MNCREKTFVESLKKPGVFIETGYENSNPSSSDSISSTEDGCFLVKQHFERGAPAGYSFHLNIALINNYTKPVSVPLRIQWGERGYDFCRDYMYIGYDSGREWRMLSVSSVEAVTEATLVLPRGRHLLCCSPKFDYRDYISLLEESSAAGEARVSQAVRTEDGNDIKYIRIGNPEGKRFLATTRAHGYETAGAYCMAGLLESIRKSPGDWRDALDYFDIYLFPMINPDAVVAGNCCLSTSGVNFGKELGSEASMRSDRAASELSRLVNSLKPHFYLDMHNNTGPHISDSLRTNNKKFLEKFNAFEPDLSCFQKIWDNFLKKYEGTRPLYRCSELYGTVPIVTEFPWYTRTPEEMKYTGVEFFRSLFEVAIGENFGFNPG